MRTPITCLRSHEGRATRAQPALCRQGAGDRRPVRVPRSAPARPGRGLRQIAVVRLPSRCVSGLLPVPLLDARACPSLAVEAPIGDGSLAEGLTGSGHRADLVLAAEYGNGRTGVAFRELVHRPGNPGVRIGYAGDGVENRGRAGEERDHRGCTSGSGIAREAPDCRRRLSPRLEVIALLPDHPPVSFTWRRKRRRVKRADGPERIFEEWWHRCETPWRLNYLPHVPRTSQLRAPEDWEWVFPTEDDGKSLPNIQRFWEDLRMESRIPAVRIQTRRHTFRRSRLEHDGRADDR